VYNTEKMLREHRDKISEADAKEIEAALNESKAAMGAGGVEAMNTATDKLTRSMHKLAEAMYRATSQQPGGGPGEAPPPRPEEAKPKDNVVDAEFVDMDDKGKK
jgi:molecular chaperone DnaK